MTAVAGSPVIEEMTARIIKRMLSGSQKVSSKRSAQCICRSWATLLGPTSSRRAAASSSLKPPARRPQHRQQIVLVAAGGLDQLRRHAGPRRRRARRLPPQQVANPQPQDDPQGDDRLVAVDLRGPLPAVDKHDGRFPEPRPQPLQTPENFLLEGVTAAADGRDVELAQDRRPIAAKAAAAILRPQAQQPAGVPIHPPAHQVPPQRPALHPAARNVARADHHVHRRAAGRVHARDQIRQITRLVAEIGVHVEHVLVALLDGVLHARQNGRPQPQFSRPVETVDAAVGGRLLVAPAAGAVRRVVVDHQQVGSRGVAENLLHQPGEILQLVVRRHRDQGLVAVGHGGILYQKSSGEKGYRKD